VPPSQGLDEAVQSYIDAIVPEHRPLFDRMHQLIVGLYPGAAVVLSYGMPTYKVGTRRLHVGAWKHGLSIYGAKQGGVAEFAARHPELKTSKGTIQLRPEDAGTLSDEDLRHLVQAALDDRSGS
jgi:uncharacterized protein YdhG (YjbR/CyaY superfamily)